MKPTLVALLVLLILPSLALPAAASHWSHFASLSPGSAIQGRDTDFSLSVTNTASGSLDVYYVDVHFCWDPSGIAYVLKENDGTSVSIPGGASRAFAGIIKVNATAPGPCAWDAQVRGKAVGDATAYTATYRGSIAIAPQSSFLARGLGGSLLVLIGGVVAVVIVLVLLVVLLRRGPAPPGRSMQPSQWHLPTQAAPQAQAYCRNCGAPLAPGAAYCAGCGTRVV